nr:molybdenum-binding subunit of ABC-transport system [Mycobacterium tuberculosis H37Rv]
MWIEFTRIVASRADAGCPVDRGVRGCLAAVCVSLRSVSMFKAGNPGVNVNFAFAGSSELATQLTQGATADVFASADTAQIGQCGQGGVAGRSSDKLRHQHDGHRCRRRQSQEDPSFADLTRPGLNVVVCQPSVPCGSATRRIEDATGIHLNPVSEELSVTDVLNKVITGQADAGLVYVSDALSVATKVTCVRFPEAAGVVNVYAIAVLKRTSQPALARQFVAMVTAAAGRRILDQSGFAKP